MWVCVKDFYICHWEGTTELRVFLGVLYQVDERKLAGRCAYYIARVPGYYSRDQMCSRGLGILVSRKPLSDSVSTSGKPFSKLSL
jgi:hypothetical protein